MNATVRPRVNPFWRSRPIRIDRLRCFAAYALSESGASGREIGELLGVSHATAQDYAFYGQKWFEEGLVP